MTQVRLGLASMALVLASANAFAQTADSAAPAAPAPEKKTCRSLMPTGTMFPTRVCNTKAAWRDYDKITSDGVGQFRDVTRMSSPGVRR